MTQFELGTDCQTQLADARVKIETLQMHKATLAAQNNALRDEIAVILRERNDAHLALAERNAFLLTSAETAQAKLAEARAESEAKDKRIAELEQLAALTPIKVGDISITLGLTEAGEARMTFDGADDATLAVVAGKFVLAMQATMESAKDVHNA